MVLLAVKHEMACSNHIMFEKRFGVALHGGM